MALAALILLAAPPAPVSAPTTGGTVRVERVAWVMGTRLRVVVDGPSRSTASAAAEAALREVERLDALLSTWDPSSPMSRANRAPPGAPVPVSRELVELLREADAWADRTGGAFEPAVGALVDAWDLRGSGRRPTAEALAEARRAAGRGVIRVDVGAATVERAAAGAWIDTGAFGKGAALRAAGRVLERMDVERAFLDLGGQVLAVGAGGWRVAVAHPVRRREPVLDLLVEHGSLATSGASERWIEVDGRRFGHLLDPRTGAPAPAWGSVTVAGADAFEADVLATALFILGPDAALAWGRDHEDVGVLVLEDRDGLAVPRWSPGFEAYLDAPLPTHLPR